MALLPSACSEALDTVESGAGTAAQAVAQVLPPFFDPADPGSLFLACGIAPVPGITLQIGDENTCGEASNQVDEAGDCHQKIRLDPSLCGSQNICCTLYHELQHVSQMREICEKCQALPPSERQQCYTCTSQSAQCLMEAEAHGATATWCAAHDPDGNPSWTVPPGVTTGVSAGNAMSCAGLSFFCGCLHENLVNHPGGGGAKPPAEGCAGLDLSQSLGFPPYSQMCACGGLCSNSDVCGGGSCGEGFYCGRCPDCDSLGCACIPEELDPVGELQCSGACPHCGDGKCEGLEACDGCPQDCGPCNLCGNAECDPLESHETCPYDCAAPVPIDDEVVDTDPSVLP